MSVEYAQPTTEVPLQYRALSTSAVVSLVLGVSSVVIFFAALTSVSAAIVAGAIPLAGLIVGVVAAKRISQDSDILTGRPVALSGIALSLVSLVGGLALAGYVYATEVPPGYARIAFHELRPSNDNLRGGLTVPPELMQYDGKKIFIKGYMRPPSIHNQNREFLLVRDNNECCFGKNEPAYYDRIQVILEGDLRADYSRGMFKVGGTLRIKPGAASAGPEQAVFTLEGDHLK